SARCNNVMPHHALALSHPIASDQAGNWADKCTRTRSHRAWLLWLPKWEPPQYARCYAPLQAALRIAEAYYPRRQLPGSRLSPALLTFGIFFGGQPEGFANGTKARTQLRDQQAGLSQTLNRNSRHSRTEHKLRRNG